MKGPFNNGGDKLKKDDYLKAVQRNYKRIYLIALSYLNNHYDAEDIMQNVFMKLLKTNKIFNSDEHIDKWLTVTCVHKCKDFFRSPFRKSTVTLEELNEIYTFDSSKKADILNSILSLPPKERTVVHLFYYEDLSVEEIAKITKSNASTVKTRLHRGRKKLKSILGDDWIDEQ